jgi:alanyl-tRNA synthetase
MSSLFTDDELQQRVKHIMLEEAARKYIKEQEEAARKQKEAARKQKEAARMESLKAKKELEAKNRNIAYTELNSVIHDGVSAIKDKIKELVERNIESIFINQWLSDNKKTIVNRNTMPISVKIRNILQPASNKYSHSGNCNKAIAVFNTQYPNELSELYGISLEYIKKEIDKCNFNCNHPDYYFVQHSNLFHDIEENEIINKLKI